MVFFLLCLIEYSTLGTGTSKIYDSVGRVHSLWEIVFR
jgi:hypothetical protein